MPKKNWIVVAVAFLSIGLLASAVFLVAKKHLPAIVTKPTKPTLKPGTLAGSKPSNGSIGGQIVYPGKAPKVETLQLPNGAVLKDQSLVVNPKNKGVSNVVVRLKYKAAKKTVAPAKTVNLRCRTSQIVELVVALRSGDTLQVTNFDATSYRLGLYYSDGKRQILEIPPTSKTLHLITANRSGEVRVMGEKYSWMASYLYVVKAEEEVAVTDSNGKFKFTSLREEPVKLRFWHQKSGHFDSTNLTLTSPNPNGQSSVPTLSGRSLILNLGKEPNRNLGPMEFHYIEKTYTLK